MGEPHRHAGRAVEPQRRLEVDLRLAVVAEQGGQLAEVAVDGAVGGEQVADLDDEAAPPDQLLVHGCRALAVADRAAGVGEVGQRPEPQRVARHGGEPVGVQDVELGGGLVVQAELGVHHGQRRPPRRPGTPEAGDRLDDRAGLVEAALLAPDAEQLHAVAARRVVRQRRASARRPRRRAPRPRANRPSPIASRAWAWRSRTRNSGWPTLVASSVVAGGGEPRPRRGRRRGSRRRASCTTAWFSHSRSPICSAASAASRMSASWRSRRLRRPRHVGHGVERQPPGVGVVRASAPRPARLRRARVRPHCRRRGRAPASAMPAAARASSRRRRAGARSRSKRAAVAPSRASRHAASQ